MEFYENVNLLKRVFSCSVNGGTSQWRCMNMVLNNCPLMWMQRFKEGNIGELCDLVVESTGLGSERSWV